MVCDSYPNPRQGRDSHVQQVAPDFTWSVRIFFHHFEYGDLGNNEDQAEESQNDHCSESEDVISNNDDFSFSDNNSDTNEPNLTSLQPLEMTFLSNPVETAIVDDEPTPTNEATAVLEDVHGFYQAKMGMFR
ncbi:hypothetical protein PoB_006599500 [Plakobranchus ocellatus]|uniref:Uncharacterized protein n=1 Tax=Plakobranchus ocellatus TaxID=259542 RepID=A0AAV4D5R2_9GAST|nr:hypothetical protein PoB_006599500 [Plakobranchus ocellatus]